MTMRLIHTLYFTVIVLFFSCSGSNEEVITYGFDKFITEGNSTSVEKEGENTLPEIHIIEIRGMNFVPKSIAAHSGDTVVWINKDLYVHDVTELTEKKWSSSKISPGDSWKMIVTEPSQYYCSIHLVMKGNIELKKFED
jgi:plastocyanin